jgi:hypothetical protein
MHFVRAAVCGSTPPKSAPTVDSARLVAEIKHIEIGKRKALSQGRKRCFIADDLFVDFTWSISRRLAIGKSDDEQTKES